MITRKSSRRFRGIRNALELLKGMWLLRNYGECTTVCKVTVIVSTIQGGWAREIWDASEGISTVYSRNIFRLSDAVGQLCDELATRALNHALDNSEVGARYAVLACKTDIRCRRYIRNGGINAA